MSYLSGVMGTLIGADLLNILNPDVLNMFSGVISIGGAGLFDGIFLTGVLASLMASILAVLFRRS
jgi:uncharacterized membrane protein